MNVLINGLPSLKPKTGVGHYTTEITQALRHEFPHDEFTLYPGDIAHPRLQTRLNRPGSPSKKATTSRWQELAKLGVREAIGSHFGAYSRHFAFDVYHETNFIPFATGLPTVLNVHDLSVILYPEWHPIDRVKHHEKHFHRGLKRADRILTISHAVRQELIQHCGVAPERITNIYCGLSDMFRPMTEAELRPVRSRLKLPAKYLLSLGTIEPRKNLETTLRAYVSLPAHIRESCPYLLAGPWGWKSDVVRDFYETVAKHRGVRHLGYIADADRPALLTAATALVYPSFYEGFGLPPVEMLRVGGRVLASTAAAVREVCGAFAQGIDPLDADGWRNAMQETATTPDDPIQRTARSAFASQFTWTRASRETHAVYREISGIEEPSTTSKRH
jgi:glycosyltransferase involved in cell wall biosynthesis